MVMKKMRFVEKWTDKIKGCIRSIRSLVKCNNILLDIIIPERGLHQGGPLSPYLFLFCKEAFSRILIHSQGQEINFAKSMVLLSPNTPRVQRHIFGDLLGMKVVEKLDNYLCLPLPIGKKENSNIPKDYKEVFVQDQ
ncbi:hypothetical protein J1N35_007770 [Gossypium stocksii]|uniref:Reverse transcriptase domain-containing protein n=1 Tax=Gossypium stocksii TaxID=47602 RepID=A0A9D3W851_9ROSI|nr:hypothetical protein J1N35_007770 [Gossypium stocksii]